MVVWLPTRPPVPSFCAYHDLSVTSTLHIYIYISLSVPIGWFIFHRIWFYVLLLLSGVFVCVHIALFEWLFKTIRAEHFSQEVKTQTEIMVLWFNQEQMATAWVNFLAQLLSVFTRSMRFHWLAKALLLTVVVDILRCVCVCDEGCLLLGSLSVTLPCGSRFCLFVFCTARRALVLCWRLALYKCFIIIIIIIIIIIKTCTGGSCEIAEIACLSVPCHNGGLCQNVGSTFSCQCPANYTGIFCETALPACYFEPCHPMATCLDQADAGFSCFCSPGMKGTTCFEEVTACDSSPCRNNATCLETPTGFQCQCTPEFTGRCGCGCVWVSWLGLVVRRSLGW